MLRLLTHVLWQSPSVFIRLFRGLRLTYRDRAGRGRYNVRPDPILPES